MHKNFMTNFLFLHIQVCVGGGTKCIMDLCMTTIIMVRAHVYLSRDSQT